MFMHKRLHDELGGADVATLVGHTVADVERELILETLKACHGNRTHAANVLGISIRTLRNKIHEYAEGGIEIPPPEQH
jgi:two-component system, response regulator FlrC